MRKEKSFKLADDCVRFTARQQNGSGRSLRATTEWGSTSVWMTKDFGIDNFAGRIPPKSSRDIARFAVESLEIERSLDSCPCHWCSLLRRN